MSSQNVVPRRRFGRTNLSMPVFSTGGMRYQQSWKDMSLQEIDAESTKLVASCIEASLKVGINHIETARGYGSSELQLGEILPHYPREDLIVQTKIGIGADVDAFRTSFETSWENLKLPYIDLLSIHGINTNEDLEKALDYGVPQLREWKRQGKIRHYGFSTHGPVDVLTRTCWTGHFDYINVHWYYVNNTNWPVIQAARAQDMGVFIISPSDKGGRLYEPTDALKEVCHPLTPMQFNDLYCLSRSEVHTLSLGASKPSDYDEHVQAMQWYGERQAITEEISARIEARIDDVFGKGWMETYAVGVPDWSMMPGGINVREILRLFTFAKVFDMVEFAKSRYNMFENAGPWFPGKAPTDWDAQTLIDAMPECPHRDRVPGLLEEAHALLKGETVQRLSVSEKEDA